MNPTGMSCRQLSADAALVTPPALEAGDADRRIVNIAGIRPGDRVMCLGDVAAGIQAAVYAEGAHVLSASAPVRVGRRRPEGKATVNVILWNIGCVAPADLAGMLADRCTDLHPGGRLVLWIVFDPCDSETVEPPEALAKRLAAVGFTSVIAGRMVWGAGDGVVATGVAGMKTKSRIR